MNIWYQRSNRFPIRLKETGKPVLYDLDCPDDIQALIEHYKAKDVEFVAESKPLPLQAVPLAILGGELGIVAKENLPPDTVLGYYDGKRVIGDEAIQGSAYAFELSEEDEEEKRYVDARYKRNFCALVNHNFLPNIEPELDDGQIKFQVKEKTIQQGEQCFISYGPDFFPNLGFNPFYLDSRDGWQDFDTIVLANKNAYLPASGYISPKLQKLFRLPTQEVLLTTLSEAILAYDEEKALALVDSQAHLWNYCVRQGKINPPKEQQRFTPLMLACTLGQTAIVEALLKKGFINRQLLLTGDTALFFTLRGFAENRIELCKLLLNYGASFTITNRERASLLNIAVEEDAEEMVTYLLKHPKDVREELFELFSNSSRDSLYKAMRDGKLNSLKAFLKLGKKGRSWLQRAMKAKKWPLKEKELLQKTLEVV